MSIAPQDRATPAFRVSVRTFLFWVLMLLLAALLWQTTSSHSGRNASQELSYSDFMQQVDNMNIASAQLVMSQSTARIEGRLRNGVRGYSVTIPKEVIPDLTERLRKQNVSISVSEANPLTFTTALLDVAPLVVLVVYCIYVLKRRMRHKQAGQ
jgi:cell division protease FtsH